MALLRTKKLLSTLLSLFSWALAISGVMVSQELNHFDPVSTMLMVVIHTVTAGFATLYAGFCLSGVDLMDADSYPFMYAFFVCMIGLSIPTGYGIVVLLVILIQKNFPTMSLTSEIYIFIACGSWAVAAVGLSVSIAINKVKTALHEHKNRRSKNLFERGLQELQKLLSNGRYDHKLFAETFRHISDPATLLTQIETSYLRGLLSLDLSKQGAPGASVGSSVEILNRSLVQILASAQVPETCSICHSDFIKPTADQDVSIRCPSDPLEKASQKLHQESRFSNGKSVDESSAIVMPGCQHVFHTDCIMRWLETSLSCPLCKSNVRTNLISHCEQTAAGQQSASDANPGLLSVQDVRLSVRPNEL